MNEACLIVSQLQLAIVTSICLCKTEQPISLSMEVLGHVSQSARPWRCQDSANTSVNQDWLAMLPCCPMKVKKTKHYHSNWVINNKIDGKVEARGREWSVSAHCVYIVRQRSAPEHARGECTSFPEQKSQHATGLHPGLSHLHLRLSDLTRADLNFHSGSVGCFEANSSSFVQIRIQVRYFGRSS